MAAALGGGLSLNGIIPGIARHSVVQPPVDARQFDPWRLVQGAAQMTQQWFRTRSPARQQTIAVSQVTQGIAGNLDWRQIAHQLVVAALAGVDIQLRLRVAVRNLRQPKRLAAGDEQAGTEYRCRCDIERMAKLPKPVEPSVGSRRELLARRLPHQQMQKKPVATCIGGQFGQAVLTRKWSDVHGLDLALGGVREVPCQVGQLSCVGEDQDLQRPVAADETLPRQIPIDLAGFPGTCGRHLLGLVRRHRGQAGKAQLPFLEERLPQAGAAGGDHQQLVNRAGRQLPDQGSDDEGHRVDAGEAGFRLAHRLQPRVHLTRAGQAGEQEFLVATRLCRPPEG